MLAGELTDVAEMYKLDTVDIPPGLYQDVRDDLATLSPVPVTRVALTKVDHAYTGIIDSSGTPYRFVLSSLGVRVRVMRDESAAWLAFDRLMDAERSTALRRRRVQAAVLPDVIKAVRTAKKKPAVKTAKKPYGHTAYTRRTSTGKMVNVKAKGVKPTEASTTPFLYHDVNPFVDNKEFRDEHRVWSILSAAKVQSQDDVREALRPHMKRLFKIDAKKHDVDDAIAQVVDHMHKHDVFKPRAAEINWHNVHSTFSYMHQLAVEGSDEQAGIQDQREVRDAIRMLLQKHGIVSHDVTLNRPGMGRCLINPMMDRNNEQPGAQTRIGGTHLWDGTLVLSKHVLGQLVDLTRAMAGRPPFLRDRDGYEALGMLAHEELHGCSPIEPSAYQGLGMIVEEVSTELAARVVTAHALDGMRFSPADDRTYGQIRDKVTQQGYPMLARYTEAGVYEVFIQAVDAAVQRGLSDAGKPSLRTPPLVVEACLKLKKADYYPYCVSPHELAMRFAEAVATSIPGLEPDAQRIARIKIYHQLKTINVETLTKQVFKSMRTHIIQLPRNDVRAALAVRTASLKSGTWLPENDTMLVHLQDDPTALIAQMSALGTVEKAAKPYGHTAYTRTSKTGKIEMVKQKGARPTKAPSTKPAAKPLPDPPRSAKSLAALAAHNPFTKEKEAWATKNEQEITKITGGTSTADNLPVDTIIVLDGKIKGVEVKTMLDNRAGKVTMRNDALVRKEQWARKHRASLHTIVIDDRNAFGMPDAYSGHRLYYKKGVGSFRLSTMIQVRDAAHLLELMRKR